MESKKTVIVTGASSGIGFAVAKAYLERGYNVVGNARTLARLESAAAKLGNPSNFLPVAGDIALPATAAALFEQAIAAFGKVDILINNAGIFIAKPVTDYTQDDVAAIVSTNLMGFFYPSQQAARHMSANQQGHIVTITASLAMQPNAKVPALLPILIKGGLNHATRGLALELAASNVRVNAVAPGIIDTPLHPDDAGTKAFLQTLSPSGKTGSTQDIVNAILYLTDSTFTSGTVMAVDGGSTAGTW
ncbi:MULTISPECIES: SDR family NAD(P)-dependent oxidoreductase [unclassified Janthinobacterium]|uniref:SDR family NAD(P)-dependent oxidoreductase n=1 Tax=unclassified Janthinobacterium TaxID=2610881 RepID=UPI00160F670C|nr:MULTISPECIES: SDR family oxidoreductase [unclassified Janthinobacterium]MBB5370067.1 NAD(P)-dependent dehydrogenase (short-subunit alcohol dehydrogenase family) [Janthinobacterium sp. K2C7]MBB5382873.1 NAD(P)-dependent dehydrogenase (short-subunit alcohol dehydrogenase family) [Janthinobacterium sp. K2Li3]MBB5384858.1 NAD(P)-dependent dehydrogenase (short-subunit alcohol dehydrogenase family) [Janthinobacterium sp. K2E3]